MLLLMENSSGSKHATLVVATSIRRWDKSRRKQQNILDGTKEICYEMIFEKHLSERRYTKALDGE